MLTFWTFRLKVLSLMVWNTVTNQEVFVKSPGSVVVVGSKGIREVNWSFAISSDEQRYLADVIITH